tara:strand:+ start:2060 stop:2266 length:207 start_codon:yes stop_codon:yes gene_type:complete
MKTIKLTTHWTTEQADDIYALLDAFKEAIWQTYGEDIIKMHQEIANENEHEKVIEVGENNNFNDELPF